MKLSKKLSQKLEKLPNKSGVYFHRDSAGKLIYVGKAANLRNRVRQYFQDSTLKEARLSAPKTAVHIPEIADIEWIETESEIDALFLEAELIKRYMPKYNLALRDDKSDLYVRLDIKSQHPTVNFSRCPLDDEAEYIGPFSSSYELKKAMRMLRKVFPYDMKKPVGAKRVSLDYHLGLSPGLEEGRTGLEEYRKNLKKLRLYLKGSRVKLVKQIEKEMKAAAQKNNFELAAKLRDQARALKSLRTQIVFGDREFIDLSKDMALNGLHELLKLKGPPRRIEGYDISHIQGQNNVASMVVFSSGLPDKAEYRKFKMKTPGNNDFAHMHEVISRRFSPRNVMRWTKPDLLLIDGGKGQLSSAKQALKESGANIPAIGLAKRREQIITLDDKSGEFKIIELPNDSHIRKLLIRIRDESHRFAVTYQNTLARKHQTKSLIEEIPGLGPATRKKLIRHFGSLRAALAAQPREIKKVIGPAKAKLLIDNLNLEN